MHVFYRKLFFNYYDAERILFRIKQQSSLYLIHQTNIHKILEISSFSERQNVAANEDFYT